MPTTNTTTTTTTATTTRNRQSRHRRPLCIRPATVPPRDDETFVSVVERHAALYPNHVLLRWLDSSLNETQTLTYQQLWEQSGRVVQLLLQNNSHTKIGDRVMISYPFGLDFLAGLLGCMRAGVIACSVYPPNPFQRSDMDKFQKQVTDAGATLALTTLKFARIMRLRSLLLSCSSPCCSTKQQRGVGSLQWLATDHLTDKTTTSSSSNNNSVSSSFVPKQNDTAFIQYTSGSTGVAKGVVISHGSLLHNVHTIMTVSQADSSDNTLIVNWMPQYHDMGLIGFFLTSVYSGFHGVAFSPLDFIQNPILWHDVMVRYQATCTVAPNFSFGLLTKRLLQKHLVDDERDGHGSTSTIQKWESIKTVFCGADPVDPDVMEKVTSVLGVPSENIMYKQHTHLSALAETVDLI